MENRAAVRRPGGHVHPRRQVSRAHFAHFTPHTVTELNPPPLALDTVSKGRLKSRLKSLNSSEHTSATWTNLPLGALRIVAVIQLADVPSPPTVPESANVVPITNPVFA